MEKRRLGRTDIQVSALCLGTMTFGEQNSEAEGHAQMDHAVEKGINFFDAAELYPIPPKKETQGRTERIVGTWFKKTGMRDKIVMATKVVGRTDMDWFRENGAKAKLVREQIEFAVDRSLKNLETDYIDLYQIHWPDRNVGGFGSNPTRWADVEPAPDENSIQSTLEILGDLVNAGKIRHVGVSNESAWGTSRFAKQGNNYFGQWCYVKGCGLVPQQRNDGAVHEVADFDHPMDSVRSYILNLNRHYTYDDLRDLRAKEIKKQGYATGLNLAAGLINYSERRMEYVKEIRSMISYNKLDKLDPTMLADIQGTAKEG